MIAPNVLRVGAIAILVCLLTACGSTTTSYEYPGDLTSPNYVERTKAARRFASTRDRSQIPVAFGLLLDDEAEIRILAYQGLVALMPDGEDFGYRAYLSADVRAGIAERWEAWWRAEASRG